MIVAIKNSNAALYPSYLYASFVFPNRYRFMVMDRLGTDLQKVLVENAEQLKKQTVLQLGCLMVNHHQYMDLLCLVARKKKKKMVHLAYMVH